MVIRKEVTTRIDGLSAEEARVRVGGCRGFPRLNRHEETHSMVAPSQQLQSGKIWAALPKPNILALAGAIGLSGISQQNIKPVAAWDQARRCFFCLLRLGGLSAFFKPFRASARLLKRFEKRLGRDRAVLQGCRGQVH